MGKGRAEEEEEILREMGWEERGLRGGCEGWLNGAILAAGEVGGSAVRLGEEDKEEEEEEGNE